jgi:hypothetical protein
MTRKRAVVCGQELQQFVPGEYPCVRRFRYRRLLTFLRLQDYGSTFVAYASTTLLLLCQFFDLSLLADQQNAWMQDVEADKLLLLRISSGTPRVPGPVDRSIGLHLPTLPAAGALFTAQP